MGINFYFGLRIRLIVRLNVRFEAGDQFEPNPVISGQDTPQERQKFIHRHLHQHIVIPGLAAALHTLLFEPVSQRADNASEEPGPVSEDGSVKNSEGDIENGRIDEPELLVPGHPRSNGNQRQYEDKRAGADHADICIVERVPAKSADDKSSQLRQDERKLQQHQAEGALLAQFFPGVALDGKYQCPQQCQAAKSQRDIQMQGDIAGGLDGFGCGFCDYRFRSREISVEADTNCGENTCHEQQDQK